MKYCMDNNKKIKLLTSVTYPTSNTKNVNIEKYLWRQKVQELMFSTDKFINDNMKYKRNYNQDNYISI